MRVSEILEYEMIEDHRVHDISQREPGDEEEDLNEKGRTEISPEDVEPGVDFNEQAVRGPAVEGVVDEHPRPAEHDEHMMSYDHLRRGDTVRLDQDEDGIEDNVGEEDKELELRMSVSSKEVEQVDGDDEGQDEDVGYVVDAVPLFVHCDSHAHLSWTRRRNLVNGGRVDTMLCRGDRLSAKHLHSSWYMLTVLSTLYLYARGFKEV